MPRVRITLNDELLVSVDRPAKRLKTTRSAFTRQALRDALARLTTCELERRHRQGYERNPPSKGEFDVWEDEHEMWPES